MFEFRDVRIEARESRLENRESRKMNFGICINSRRTRESDLCLEEMNNSANRAFVRNIHVDSKQAFNVLGLRKKYYLHYPSECRVKMSRSYSLVLKKIHEFPMRSPGTNPVTN